MRRLALFAAALAVAAPATVLADTADDDKAADAKAADKDADKPKKKRPLSDVASQHRSVSTCHLGNIAMRLGRPLAWDAAKEQFSGDDEANAWLRRTQRKGFEVA